MISRITELSRRLMSGGRGSRFLGGAVCGAMIGAALLLSGLAVYLIAVLTGLDWFSVEGLSIAPMYILSFALAGGVVGLLWGLTRKILGAILAGFLGMLVVSTGCLIIVGFELLLKPLPEVLAFMILYSALLGSIVGLGIWGARKKPKPNPRDEWALDGLLLKCGLSRQALNDEQTSVLRSYCRRRRQMRWAVVMVTPVAATLLYMGLVVLPNQALSLGENWIPTQGIFVDKASETSKDLGPNEELARLMVRMILHAGMLAGVAAACGFFMLIQAVFSLIGDWKEWTLIQFLKATAGATPTAGAKE